jgi:uncharacterized protein YndB with AHSA1/START domain
MDSRKIHAKSEMLIRKPVEDVFEMLVDPERTSKVWFTRGSGRLEAGQRVQWYWDMYGSSVQVEVKAIEPNRRILVDWSAYGAPSSIEWLFTPRADGTTFVCITNSGFSGSEEEIVQTAINSTEGFTYLLAALKGFLEHNIQLNFVRDRFPDGIPH